MPSRRRILGSPAEFALDHRVIAIATVHSLWRIQVVATLYLDSGDLFEHIDQAVNGGEFARTQVDWLDDVAAHDVARAFHAVIDVHEAARLVGRRPRFQCCDRR